MGDPNNNSTRKDDLLRNLVQDIVQSDHVDSAVLSEYVDGTLPLEAQTLVQAHVDTCSRCKHRVELMRRSRTVSAGEPDVQYNYERIEQVSKPPFVRMSRLTTLAVGLASLAIIVVGGFYLAGRKGAGQDSMLAALDVSYNAGAEANLPAILGAENLSRKVRGNDDGSGPRILSPRNHENLIDDLITIRLSRPTDQLLHVTILPVSGGTPIKGDIPSGKDICHLRVPRGSDYYWQLTPGSEGDTLRGYLSFHVLSMAESRKILAQASARKKEGPFHYAAFLWEQGLYTAWETRTKLNLQMRIPNGNSGDLARLRQLRKNFAEYEKGDLIE